MIIIMKTVFDIMRIKERFYSFGLRESESNTAMLTIIVSIFQLKDEEFVAKL